MAKHTLSKLFFIFILIFILYGCPIDEGPDDMSCVEKAFAGGHHYMERSECVRVMFGDAPDIPTENHVEAQVLVDGVWLWIHVDHGDIFLSDCPDVFRGDEDFVILSWPEFLQMECTH